MHRDIVLLCVLCYYWSTQLVAESLNMSSRLARTTTTGIHEVADEQRLLYNLLQGYEKSVRPVRNASTPIVVRLGISLTHLFDLDERNQVLTTMVWLNQEWYDELLTWDPADYNGLAVLVVPCDFLWLPDMVLYNNADDYVHGYVKSRALLYNNGTVFWPPPTKMRSTCKVNIEYFPFDTQECEMKFGSWVYNGFQVDVVARTDRVDLSDYVKNGEWELQSVVVERRVTYYASCCPEPFPDLTFRLVIRRKVLYYAYSTLLPCIMMSALTVLVFVLPPDSGEKIALGITVILAFSVIMLSIIEKLPETSDSIPLIGSYLNTVMSLAAISVMMTVAVINIDWRQPEKHPMPDWVKRLILGKLAYMLCVRTDYNPRSRVSAHHEPPPSDICYSEDMYGSPWMTHRSWLARGSGNSHGSPARSQRSFRRHEEEVSSTKRSQEEELLPVRTEWRQVAQVMDRCLFWLFSAATVVATVVLLLIYPMIGDSNTAVPLEDTL
ncbi:Neuronal acetylcholine receptor subunit beta-3 [Hypsibius exemplaris]|uniref:Neuronal acetylcholine receptor subunit beta-3 n=1 Tax=Hypsibius exemplaris TaxID=2072580 RepID=A0A9X6RL89_HYPEX|nr:Neuronal acetylcholine receptor subunit beta-3 [Hypsibius exemplaris]